MGDPSAEDGPEATPEKPSAEPSVNYSAVASGPVTIMYGAEWVALAMASGIIGNLSYDALKTLRKRLVRHSSKEFPSSLQPDDALEVTERDTPADSRSPIAGSFSLLQHARWGRAPRLIGSAT